MSSTSSNRSAEQIQCRICRHFHEFQLPDDVLDAARNDRLVIFAGAGVSTESRSVLPYTFYDEVARELGSRPRSISGNFPEVMSEYCKRPNGRRKLLQKLRARFDYIDAFPTLLSGATRFHEELSTIPHLNSIVTTNWDAYFERFCGATPFVSPQDFVFWDMPGRKVFKIHGSVNNYGSIIATNEDYNRCYEELTRGLIGSNLRMLLATKVVVFVGYSLRDHDFSRICDVLRAEMTDVLPHAYGITISTESSEHFKKLGLTPIVTDGAHFLQVLKSHLAAGGLMVTDDRYSGVYQLLDGIQEEHRLLHQAFCSNEHPELIHCASYQDGLSDALGRIIRRMRTGEYSCPDHVRALIRRYLELQKNARSRKKYTDVAYIEGYVNGLFYLVLDDKARKTLPRYFVHGHEGNLLTLHQYKRVAKNARKYHRAAFEHAAKIAWRLADGVEYHHIPLLL